MHSKLARRCRTDAGLLLFKEFLFKIGAIKLINCVFKTNDTAWFRIHKDDQNLMQVIYQIISAYFEDDCADELTNAQVITAILDKDALASQPTLSRFFYHMDRDTLSQLNLITRELRKIIYSIKKPEYMLFNIDSTLLDTYDNQEVEGFNIFMKSLLEEFTSDFPDMLLYLRGDSGFASPELYKVLEDKNCLYY